MAKGIGLIGNFKGKVGNMVGYKLTDSNSGNNQGIRVYQPIVKNPKTAAQAEQRAKLAPINATYRALKMVIDRGNEGLPYGNKSRLAWLKQAFKSEHMPWFEKGKQPNYPVACQLTKGSLSGFVYRNASGILTITCPGVTSETDVTTIGKLSTAILAGVPSIKAGDQVTFVMMVNESGQLLTTVKSFVIDTSSADAQDILQAGAGRLEIDRDGENVLYAVILSREGEGGEHLRSSSDLLGFDPLYAAAPYNATSKTAAIESYRDTSAVNADWAEESIQ